MFTLFAIDPTILQYPLAGLVALAVLGIGVNTWFALMVAQPQDAAPAAPLAPPADTIRSFSL